QIPFDDTEIIAAGAFTDTQSFAAIDMQTFLEHTPYKRSSFLSTYQSNGVRAVDAVMSSAFKYHINPLVFLVRAEVDQGLIGAQYYPFPTSRVEYVFGCGCAGANACDPALAGFDRQVDCLGRKLSTSLTEIAASGATAGGWGPGNESVTLDGLRVTPQDASTAALYQYNPLVAVGSGGNWLMWNIWQFYANFLTYDGPVGGSMSGGGWIGDGCTSDANCGVPDGFCATNFPGGMCTIACTDACPTGDDRPASFCGDFGGGSGNGYCLPVCNPGVTGTCRDGYDCKSILVFGSSDSQNGCTQAAP
ncbi:MAG: hypothetical protein ABI461_04145, partial [Polyangiaceae bacterium]